MIKTRSVFVASGTSGPAMSVGLCESHEPANSEARATASASKANGEQ